MTDTNTKWDGIIIRLRSAGESIVFPTLVKEALNAIYSKPVGRSLLDQIAALAGKKKYGYTVVIMRPKDLRIVQSNAGLGRLCCINKYNYLIFIYFSK